MEEGSVLDLLVTNLRCCFEPVLTHLKDNYLKKSLCKDEIALMYKTQGIMRKMFISLHCRLIK